jgi:hypothetical protein
MENTIEWTPQNYAELRRKMIKREDELIKLKQNYHAEIYALNRIKDFKKDKNDTRIKTLYEAEDRINLELNEIASLMKQLTEALDNMHKFIKKTSSNEVRITQLN